MATYRKHKGPIVPITEAQGKFVLNIQAELRKLKRPNSTLYRVEYHKQTKKSLQSLFVRIDKTCEYHIEFNFNLNKGTINQVYYTTPIGSRHVEVVIVSDVDYTDTALVVKELSKQIFVLTKGVSNEKRFISFIERCTVGDSMDTFTIAKTDRYEDTSRGIDFNATFHSHSEGKGITMPLQIKSSSYYQESHKKDFSKVPSIVINDLVSDEEMFDKFIKIFNAYSVSGGKEILHI